MHGLLVFDESNDRLVSEKKIALYREAFKNFDVSLVAVSFDMLNALIEGSQKDYFSFAILIDEDIHLAKHLVEIHQIRVFNNETAMTNTADKALALIVMRNESISTPPTFVLPYSRNMSVLTNTYELNTMYQQLSFPCLVKERFYQKGTKPYFIQDVETLKGVLKQLEMKPLMVQLYVPYEGRREFQVFVVGNRVITAMELIIKDQESKFIEVEVPLIVKNISIKAMSSIGADFAVVHVLFDLQQIPYVYALETQPDILNIQSVTGVSVCGYIARHIVKTLKSKD